MQEKSGTSFTCSFTNRAGVRRKRTATIQRVAFMRTIREILGDLRDCSSMHLRTARHCRMGRGGNTARVASSATSVTLQWKGCTIRTSTSGSNAIGCAATRWTSAPSTTTRERRASLTNSASSTSSHARAPSCPTLTTYTRSSKKRSQRSRSANCSTTSSNSSNYCWLLLLLVARRQLKVAVMVWSWLELVAGGRIKALTRPPRKIILHPREAIMRLAITTDLQTLSSMGTPRNNSKLHFRTATRSMPSLKPLVDNWTLLCSWPSRSNQRQALQLLPQPQVPWKIKAVCPPGVALQ